MNRKLALGISIAAIAALGIVGTASVGETQAGGALTVGIYAPTVNFGGTQARFAYVQDLARALSTATGRKVTGKAFTSLSQLKRSKPQFAVIDGQCYAANSSWTLLANSVVLGGTKRTWGLFSNVGSNMESLRGKKLAYVKMGCRDTDFIENAMLESEISMSFFGGQVAKQDLQGAVAEVATLKGAQAVFAPLKESKGLTKVFTTSAVPNPAFVQLDKSLPADVVANARKAVVGYGGSGAISGWNAANASDYSGLRSRLSKRTKKGIFATPDLVRVDATDVLVDPDTLDAADLPSVAPHFEEPPKRQ